MPGGSRNWPSDNCRMSKAPTIHHQSGFTYLGLLFAVMAMGLSMALASEVWTTSQQREKENELLFIGHQFREAIRLYYETSPGGNKVFPHSLEELLQDPRFPEIRRHLRRVFADPMTGSTDWGIVTSEHGGIEGVYSLSVGAPVKTANFDAADTEFAGKQSYAEWKFVYVPSSNPVPAAAEEGEGENLGDPDADPPLPQDG